MNENEMVVQLKKSAKELAVDLDFYPSLTVLKKARENNINGYVVFNGKTLYSLFDSEDDCYLKVYGRTKEQHEEYMQNLQDIVMNKQKEGKLAYEKKAPELIESGKKVIVYPQRQDQWAKSIEFQGTMPYPIIWPHEVCLDVLKRIEKGEDAKAVIDSIEQGATDEVLALISVFHKDGIDIVKGYKPESATYWGERFKKIAEENAKFESELGEPAGPGE